MPEQQAPDSEKAAAPPPPDPIPTPFPSERMGLSRETVKQMRRRGQRYLFINVLLMFFVSLVVFVIGTYFFLVPRIVANDLALHRLEAQLARLRQSPPASVREAPAAAPAETAAAADR